MGENNWDLQAVVRSCTGSTVTPHDRDPFSSFFSSPVVGDIDVDAKDEIFIPDLSSTRSPVVQELEELYKPFFRWPSMPSSWPQETNTQQQQQQQQLQRSFSEPARSKKRKKQQKKIVCQVPVDGLSTDVWAWRKYGQKPIKGSPYPRGYYRCSSSKGCPARKQVERSRAEPGVLIITYAAEHNHPIPTHRNSLAGSTRQKLSNTSQKVNAAVGVNVEKVNASASSSSPPVLSPPPPEAEEEEDEEDGMLLETDMGMLGEDMLFAALGEPGQPPPSIAAATIAAELTDQFSSTFSSSPWTPGSTAATASRI